METNLLTQVTSNTLGKGVNYEVHKSWLIWKNITLKMGYVSTEIRVEKIKREGDKDVYLSKITFVHGILTWVGDTQRP